MISLRAQVSPRKRWGAVHGTSRGVFEPVGPEAHRRLVYWRPGCPHGDQAGTPPRYRGRSVGCSSLGPVQCRSRAPSRPGSNAIPWRHGWSTQLGPDDAGGLARLISTEVPVAVRAPGRRPASPPGPASHDQRPYVVLSHNVTLSAVLM